jgi:hypothetical protein
MQLLFAGYAVAQSEIAVAPGAPGKDARWTSAGRISRKARGPILGLEKARVQLRREPGQWPSSYVWW